MKELARRTGTPGGTPALLREAEKFEVNQRPADLSAQIPAFPNSHAFAGISFIIYQ
jgi:hypothetical protein